VVHSTIPLFRWTREVAGGVYTSVRRCVGVRVYLKRPWFVTGHGETLGVVVHHSQQHGDALAESPDRDLFTRWAADPYEGVSPGSPPAGHFVGANVLNPVGGTLCANIPGTAGKPPQVCVAVAPVEAHFDAERDLWCADVELAPGDTQLGIQRWPFLRLGLVRFQPGTAAPGGGPQTSYAAPHASRVVHTDFVQLPPERRLTAQREGPGRISLRLGTRDFKRHGYTTRWQKRLLEPLASPAPDLCRDTFEIEGLVNGLSPTPDGSQASGVLDANVTGTSLAELQAGRIVVEELQFGRLVEGQSDEFRVVYRDVFDYAVFDRPDGPV
jgi:hypothetical protein